MDYSFRGSPDGPRGTGLVFLNANFLYMNYSGGPQSTISSGSKFLSLKKVFLLVFEMNGFASSGSEQDLSRIEQHRKP